MALTEDESRQWNEIATALRRSDPDLGGTPCPARPKVTRFGTRVVAVGLPVLVVGAVLQQPLVCMVGWFALVAGAIARCAFA